MEQFLVIMLLIGVAAGAFTATVAKAKGYDGTAWFIGGLCFSIFALIAIAGMPMKQDDEEEKEEEETEIVA